MLHGAPETLALMKDCPQRCPPIVLGERALREMPRINRAVNPGLVGWKTGNSDLASKNTKDSGRSQGLTEAGFGGTPSGWPDPQIPSLTWRRDKRFQD